MHPGHDLMPLEVQKALPGLEETAHLKSSEMPIVVKYFHPTLNFTWYIGAGDKMEDGEYLQPGKNGGVEEIFIEGSWMLFGWYDLGMETPELGYVSLHDLKTLHEEQVGLKALPVERDLHFNPDGNLTLQDAIDGRV